MGQCIPIRPAKIAFNRKWYSISDSKGYMKWYSLSDSEGYMFECI
jgi:hypothetical protein